MADGAEAQGDAGSKSTQIMRDDGAPKENVSDAKHGAEQAVGLGHGLPDAILVEVLNFCGLREFGACTAASEGLRRGLSRLSPALEHRLVMRRFPMLAVTFEGTDATDLPPPRELVESQARLFRRPRPSPLTSIRTLEDYAFVLEVEVSHLPAYWAGKGSLFTHASRGWGFKFDIPKEIFERSCDAWEFGYSQNVNIMATRRSSEGIQRTRLGSGDADDIVDGEAYDYSGTFLFDNLNRIPVATGWLWQQALSNERGRGRVPSITGSWSGDVADMASASDFEFYFGWDEVVWERMSVEDVCLALEHFYSWV